MALDEQVPAHGSIHLFLTQDRSLGQSWLTTHSGLQPLYGSPWYSGMQEQIPSLQLAFAPQGDRIQGSSSITGTISIGLGKQLLKGSPVISTGQVQMELWLNTLQTAFKPQDPGHGSTHFLLMQAKLLEHSELIVHSGRQFGGIPMYCERQEQDGSPLISLHWELGPHGDGLHGSNGVVSTGAEAKINIVNVNISSSWTKNRPYMNISVLLTLTLRRRITSCKGVTYVTILATTYRTMIDNLTLRI